MRTPNGLMSWLRARRAGWSVQSDRAFHDALFAAHDHDPFSPAYTGNITVRRFADLAMPHVEGRCFVVDIGCGLGEITCELARRLPESRFLGVDHSRAGVAGARRNAERLALTNISFEVHDMESFTPDDAVDLVTMFDAFHHLLDPHAFIRRMGKPTRRFLLVEPQGDWKGSWVRDLDFDWLAQDLEKIRAHLAYATGEQPAPIGGGSSAQSQPDDTTPSQPDETTPGQPDDRAPGEPADAADVGDGGEPVENRYSIETFEKMFRGYGLRIRGTISGLDEYPPEPTLDTPTRRQFGELAYQLYRSADDRLYEGDLDLHAKHLIIYAEAGTESERRAPPAAIPEGSRRNDLRGAHDVAYLGYDGPRRVSSGGTFRAKVNLRNRSFRAWSSSSSPHPDLVSYHWLDERGQVVVEDGIRSPLPRSLPPGEELEVALRIEAPARAGSYILSIDLVQEGRAWFRDAGSPTLDVLVRVED